LEWQKDEPQKKEVNLDENLVEFDNMKVVGIHRYLATFRRRINVNVNSD
jgi:hypothetical protein